MKRGRGKVIHEAAFYHGRTLNHLIRQARCGQTPLIAYFSTRRREVNCIGCLALRPKRRRKA